MDVSNGTILKGLQRSKSLYPVARWVGLCFVFAYCGSSGIKCRLGRFLALDTNLVYVACIISFKTPVEEVVLRMDAVDDPSSCTCIFLPVFQLLSPSGSDAELATECFRACSSASMLRYIY